MLVFQNSREVVGQLEDVGVFETTSSCCDRAIYEGTGHVALNVALAESVFEQWFHDFVYVVPGETRGYQAVLNGFGDRCLKAVPCIGAVQFLGSERIAPLFHSGDEVFLLIFHGSVGARLYA